MKLLFRSHTSRAARALEALAALALAVVLVYFGARKHAGDGGLAHVADDRLAIVTDLARGKSRVVTAPGMQLFVPWLQEIATFDKSPLEYRMEGDGPLTADRAPRLRVRANDGSSFWFEAFSLHYAVLPELAQRLLEDSGPGERFKTTLVNAFARAVLRDEFGRFSAEEIVEPENLHAATRRSRERLDELLHPHGLAILETTTSKPRFDTAYETAIERRKIAGQMIEHQRSKRVQLEQEKIQLEERVRKEKEIERRNVERDFEQQRLAAERDAIRIRADVEVFARELLGNAAAQKAQKEQQALALTARFRLEAQDLATRLSDLAARGDSAVRAAWIERLRSIEFSIVPYTRDSSPGRVEYEQPPAGAKSKG